MNWCQEPDSNRQGLLRRIFVTLRLSPPAFAVRALDYASTMALRALGPRRLVSTRSQSKLSFARRCLGDIQGFHRI